MSYQIFSDSSCDLPEEYWASSEVIRIPFYVSFDQETYQKEIEEVSVNDFYQQLMANDVFPKTSLPSIDDYMNAFRPTILAGDDVLCICLTDKFSGSYQSAVTAKDLLEEEYPEANIHVMNSILATGAQGLLVLQAAQMKKDGLDLDSAVDNLERIKHTGRVMFTLGTLEYLQKGGRIGKAAAMAGNILNLKPIIQLVEGELAPAGKVRGSKKALEQSLNMVKEYFESISERYYQYDFCVITGIDFEGAETFKQKLSDLIDEPIHYPVFQLGTTIGTYTGPDIIGACFIKRYDA